MTETPMPRRPPRTPPRVPRKEPTEAEKQKFHADMMDRIAKGENTISIIQPVKDAVATRLAIARGEIPKGAKIMTVPTVQAPTAREVNRFLSPPQQAASPGRGLGMIQEAGATLREWGSTPVIGWRRSTIQTAQPTTKLKVTHREESYSGEVRAWEIGMAALVIGGYIIGHRLIDKWFGKDALLTGPVSTAYEYTKGWALTGWEFPAGTLGSQFEKGADIGGAAGQP